jgi:hypothetical protein
LRTLEPRPAGEGDPYGDLLSETRAMRREHRIERDAWFGTMAVDGKDDLLFEFEVLLKGTACFANPRNHPGPPRRGPIVAHDFRSALVIAHDGAARAITLARQLLGASDRAFVFQRYLETVLPEDNTRTRLLQPGDQATPEDSLRALRYGLTTANEVVEGVLRSQRIPYRLFYSCLAMMQRETAQNAFFNPLTALEFRPEFDRIHSPAVLDLIHTVPGAESRRLVALTFLSLFRMLRYLRLIGRVLPELGQRRRQASARVYLTLSVLRSDARALSDYLRRRAGALLAASFYNDLFRVPAAEIPVRASELRGTAHRLLAIRSALEGIAANLRLEMRRAFQHDLPSPDQLPSTLELRRALESTLGNLRPALRNAILFLGKTLGVSLDEGGVFDDHTARRESSERLRRDVWMFAQIVRAFSTKARHSPAEDRWAPVHSFEYVREFLAYFRAMGYPLLRATDYPRFDAFLDALSHLEDTDLVDPTRLENAIDECVAFTSFLEQLFDSISRREELGGIPFDRRAAAASLRLYLGDQ